MRGAAASVLIGSLTGELTMTPDQEANILEILDGAQDMTVATLRADGYPQATTVSFVHVGPTIYFGCGADSQKAENIARSDKISLTVNLPYRSWDEIRGLSLGGRAQFVRDRAETDRMFEAAKAKFPQIEEYVAQGEQMQLRVVRVKPEIISLLDYRKGFGHTEEIKV